MSLDDIIKQGKKSGGGAGGQKSGGKFSSPKGGARGASNKRIVGGGRKRLGGIKKKNNNSPNKNNNQNKSNGKQTQRGAVIRRRRQSIAQRKIGQVLSNSATTNLVRKLVKRALSQATSTTPMGRGRRFGGGIRAKLQRAKPLQQRLVIRRGRVVPATNGGGITRVNQRSRAITRRPRIVMAPVIAQPSIAVNPGRRRRPQPQRQLIQYIPVPVSSVQGGRMAILPSRNGGRRGNQNFIPHNTTQFVQFSQPQRRQQFVVGGGRGQQQQRQMSIRQQVNALRRVGNAPQPQQRRVFIRQPQQNQQQFQQRRPSFNQQFSQQRRVVQRTRSFNPNQPFVDPPNFLQRF